MIVSMTGYGRHEINLGRIHFTVEVRSVNNRFIDVQVKAPRALSVLEPRIKKLVQDRCSRGRFDVFISRNGDRETAGRLVVDEALADQYVGILKDLKGRFGLSGEIDLRVLTGFPGLIAMTEEKEDIDAIWSALTEGLEHALTELYRMRAEEGKSLVRDMHRRIDAIEGFMASIHTLAPASVELSRKRISDSLARLLNEPPDPVRMAQEIAILAERTDVTEELTRLSSHIGQFRMLTSQQGAEAVGRKLDFLLQEMGREANTISSKAMSSEIAHHVVDIKAELEKVREQVQNIE